MADPSSLIDPRELFELASSPLRRATPIALYPAGLRRLERRHEPKTWQDPAKAGLAIHWARHSAGGDALLALIFCLFSPDGSAPPWIPDSAWLSALRARTSKPTDPCPRNAKARLPMTLCISERPGDEPSPQVLGWGRPAQATDRSRSEEPPTKAAKDLDLNMGVDALCSLGMIAMPLGSFSIHAGMDASSVAMHARERLALILAEGEHGPRRADPHRL